MRCKRRGTVVVDDEPIARDYLCRLLQHEDDIEILAICANGEEALDALHEHTPDLVFLDVQMPRFGGFEVLKRYDPEEMPAIVFVTAFDEYA